MSLSNVDKTTPPHDRSITTLLPIVVFIFGVAALWTYLGVCAYSSIKLARAVPVSSDDLRSSSWLSATTYQYFGYFMPKMIGGMLVALGLLIVLMQESFKPLIIHLPIGICLLVFTDSEAMFRSAALDGVARIGCFSFEGRECRQMLGLDSTDAPSMYQDAMRKNGYWAPWYAEVRNKLPTPDILPLPGNSFWFSPFEVRKAEELNRLLSAQRTELARIKGDSGLARSQ
ncbi:hypothetical protein BLL42_27685 (plasmid) [Pseudomonas frederiksbergensis]|uniref:Uncharacterized protein n=1 Tax=Pseudomonas frederiksbergensis TaxID=104087 RepID=A0A1J0ETN8_9PSED|nr:hypothetical protein [Pseudomonas frederiksbergensis]APC19514.1 hypothetical protein BLL42_27685 [Pseudomonas frederiksbergensis]